MLLGESSVNNKPDEYLNINTHHTNIEKVHILTQYELKKSGGAVMHNITPNIKKFLKYSIGDFDYQIFDALIDEDGEISNFKFRMKDKLNILNELNILKYLNHNLPKEFRNKYKVENDYLFTVRFYCVNKTEVSEEDTDQIIEDGGLVVMEDDCYIHLQKEYTKSVQKYWTENPFKAIFALKGLGFYLGSNDPDKNENSKLLEEYAGDDEIILMAKNDIPIGNIQSNMVEIEKIKIPFLISETIKKEYNQRPKNIPRPKNINKIFKGTEPNELPSDVIPKEAEKAKLPRRPVKINS